MVAPDAAGRQLARRLAPLGVLDVVDDVVGAELLELVGFGFGGGGGDDAGAGGFGELRGWLVGFWVLGVGRGGGGGGGQTCSAKRLTPPVPWTRTVWPGLRGLRP